MTAGIGAWAVEHHYADGVHPNCAAVNAVLEAAGAPGRVRVFEVPVPTAAAAASELGVAVGAIANSLVFTTDGGEQVLIMTSGAHRVDTAKAAAVLSVTRLDRASAQEVLAATGQKIGGVAPVGHPAPLRTLIDADLSGYEQIWAAGGIPQAVFPTSFDELVVLTGGTVAEVA